jgi:hypothetical protein
MEFHALQTLSLPFVVQDVLVAIGAGVALLAGLVFINLGLVLPGLLTSLGGPPPDQRGVYLEFGPTSGPLISEPAPPRAMAQETDSDPKHGARPHLWGTSREVASRI